MILLKNQLIVVLKHYLNNYLNSRKKQELNKILPHKFGILEKISKFAAVSPL